MAAPRSSPNPLREHQRVKAPNRPLSGAQEDPVYGHVSTERSDSITFGL